MRAYLPAYELKVPRTLSDALELLARDAGAWRAFAGGTDLMVLLEAGRLEHRRYFSIWHLPELRGIEETAEWVTLGALTTYTEVRRNSVLAREFPSLGRAAAETGGPAIQNRGTLGGNICNASPAADSPPALLAYDAEVELLSADGARWVAYKDFHTGYKQTVMRPDELLARVRLPRRNPQATRHYYRKVGTRKAQAISKVCFAATAEMDGGQIARVRLALGSVAPTVVRSTRVEQFLQGRALDRETFDRAAEELTQELSPIDDVRSTARYRLRVARNLLRDFLEGLR